MIISLSLGMDVRTVHPQSSIVVFSLMMNNPHFKIGLWKSSLTGLVLLSRTLHSTHSSTPNCKQAPVFISEYITEYLIINTFSYTRFELILRLRANYLWPAMWSSAFAEDDTLNQYTADMYGVVMGTRSVLS